MWPLGKSSNIVVIGELNKIYLRPENYIFRSVIKKLINDGGVIKHA